MAEHKHSKYKGFLNISREAEIHTISKPWDELIPILWTKQEKHRQFPGSAIPKNV